MECGCGCHHHEHDHEHSHEHEHHHAHIHQSKLRLLAAELEKGKYVLLSFFVLLLSFGIPLLEGGLHQHAFGESQSLLALEWHEYLSIIPILLCGIPIVYGGLYNLLAKRRIRSSLLITIAIFASIYIGQLLVAGEVAFLMALGEYLEDKTLSKAKRGIDRLMKLVPDTVKVLVDGQETEKHIADVQVGELLRIRPGEIIPLDGEVAEGSSAINQSNITGESLPVDVSTGSKVYSGSQNMQGSLLLRVMSKSDSSSMQRMISLMNMAEHSKARIEHIADRWAAALVPAALVVALLVYLLTGDIVRMVSVLVVFCPCAFALATPTCIVAAIGQASGKGVLIKNKTAIEILAKCDTMAFDKTGTLTRGRLSLSDVLPLTQVRKEEILKISRSLEHHSEHPIAKAIVSHEKDAERYAVEDFRALTGLGVEGRIAGKSYRIVKTAHPKAKELAKQGKATMALLEDDAEIAILALRDELKSEARATIEKLNQMGVKTVLLSGDSEEACQSIAAELSIEEYRAELLPEDKLYAIESLKQQARAVTMIGDGMNDAPALKMADASVAMADSGSGVSVEAADIALLGDDIAKLPYVKRLAEVTIRNVKFNLSISMLINFAAVILSALGMLNPLAGALVHNVGSVLVTLNAALLYRRRIRVRGSL